MILTITNDFGTYRLLNPVIVDGGTQGQCLRAEYQVVSSASGYWWDGAPPYWMLGDFRTDRIIDSRIEKR